MPKLNAELQLAALSIIYKKLNTLKLSTLKKGLVSFSFQDGPTPQASNLQALEQFA